MGRNELCMGEAEGFTEEGLFVLRQREGESIPGRGNGLCNSWRLRRAGLFGNFLVDPLPLSPSAF